MCELSDCCINAGTSIAREGSLQSIMRTKAELAELASANVIEQEHAESHSFLTEHQRAALDAALAAKQTAPSKRFVHCTLAQSKHENSLAWSNKQGTNTSGR